MVVEPPYVDVLAVTVDPLKVAYVVEDIEYVTSPSHSSPSVSKA